MNSIVRGVALAVDDRSDSLLALDSCLVKPVAGRELSVGNPLVADSFGATLGDYADSPGDFPGGAPVAHHDYSLE